MEQRSNTSLDYFGSWASEYDAKIRRCNYVVPGIIALQLKEHFVRTKQSSPFIADIGAGTGLLGLAIKELIPRANLTGTDLSANMIQMAKRKKAYYHFTVSDAKTGLPEYDSDTKDGVASSGASEYIADTERLVSEMARIVKPHGIVSCSFLLDTQPFQDIQKHDPSYYPKGSKAETRENVRSLFVQNGLTITTETTVTGYRDRVYNYAPDYYIISAVKPVV